MLALTLRGSYDREHIQKRGQQFRDVVGASFLAFAVVASFSYIFKSQFSRGFLLYALTFTVVMLTGSRWILWSRFHQVRGFDLLQHRTLTITSQTQGGATDAVPARSEVTILAPGPVDFEGWLTQVIATVELHHIDVVVLQTNHGLTDNQLSQLSWVLEGSVDIAKQVAIGDLGRRAYLQTTSEGTFLHLKEIGLTGPQAAVKRVFDITFSLSALLVLSPVFILTALAVRASSRGSAFYIQKRIGRHGELIAFPKFRSMRVGADKERAEVLGRPDDDMLNRYRNDPRITAVGRVIRRLSIDELPQLWSVLKGDMSIVGPRPILQEELQLLENGDYRRHAAKPGLTGLWQVSGRKEVPWEERMKMDIHYLEHWALTQDLALIVRTLATVFTGRGAM
jgi:exopolysaccharide biosynthesis polyprenyl glycosylphosphotransferase